MKRKDATQEAADLVSAVTGQKKPRGVDLVKSPELKRLFKEAKAKEAARKKRRK